MAAEKRADGGGALRIGPSASGSSSMPPSPRARTQTRQRFAPSGKELACGLAHVAAYVAIGSFLLGFDWFGLSTAANARSSDVLGQIFASKYDRDGEKRPQRPAVIMVTDETLRHPVFDAERKSWPPSFDVHAKVLGRLLEEQPALVFLDVLFRDGRGPRTRLANVVDAYAAAATPLLVAHGADCPPAPDAPRAIGEPRIRPPFDRAYPVAVPALFDERDNMLRQYPLRTAVDDPEDGKCPTAALAMYRYLRGGDIEGALRRIPASVQPPLDEPLEVIWGARRSDAPPGRPSQDEAASAAADATDAPCGEHVARSPWKALWWSFIGHDLRQSCPYFETIPAEELMVKPLGETGLAGRPVLYGLSFAGADDVIFPPAHRRLSGIHQHAMALDNLLAWNDTYVRRAPHRTLGPFTVPSPEDLAVLTVSGALFATWRWARRERRGRKLLVMAARPLLASRIRTSTRDRRPLLWAAAIGVTTILWLVPVATVLTVGLVLYWRGEAPLNWVGQLVVFGGVMATFELVAEVKNNHATLLKASRGRRPAQP
jgi:CHASE2 domain-containing sensor protein